MLSGNSKAKWLIGAAAVVLLVMALGGVTVFQRQAKKPEPKKVEPPPPLVLASGAELTYTGAISSRDTRLLPAPVEGTMETVEVEPGQEVFEGWN